MRKIARSMASLSALSVAAAALVLAGCGAQSDFKTANQGQSKVLALGGTRLSEAQVATYLRDAGFPESAVPTMVCIAKYESSFYTGASNVNTDGSSDYGLFQINDYYWLGPCGVSRSGLMDPSVNARCALTVYRQQGFNAWYGYQYNAGECSNYHNPGGAGGIQSRVVSQSVNKFYSGPTKASAFCDNLPVGTKVITLDRKGSMLYVQIPNGVCKDFAGKWQTIGWFPEADTKRK